MPSTFSNESGCDSSVYWWDGEYEGECELPKGHEGDHYDGLSWWNDDKEDTSYDHAQENNNL